MVLDKILRKKGKDVASTPSKSASDTPTRKPREVSVIAVTPTPAKVTPSNDKKRTRLSQASPSVSASPASAAKKKTTQQRTTPAAVSVETGDGTVSHPFRSALRHKPNASGCWHCPADQCCCSFFAEVLRQVFESIPEKRVTEVAGKRDLCAKSILPPFVSRLVRILKLKPEETFFDLGCGNGSVLFQVAFMTGVRCVGVEMSPRNAVLARKAWGLLKPLLEKKAKRPMPEIQIITGDLTELIASDDFVKQPCAIWTANLLMPKSLTHYMSERFRFCPPDTRILCFDDLYPHSRSVATIRDPEAFRLFEMVDYVWSEMSVEWTAEVGKFYFYRRTRALVERSV